MFKNLLLTFRAERGYLRFPSFHSHSMVLGAFPHRPLRTYVATIRFDTLLNMKQDLVDNIKDFEASQVGPTLQLLPQVLGVSFL